MPQPLLQAIDLGEQDGGFLIKLPPGDGQVAGGSAPAVQQLAPDLGFQRPDVVAYRGLRNRETLRAGRKTALTNTSSCLNVE
jgi:hypothetical protein